VRRVKQLRIRILSATRLPKSDARLLGFGKVVAVVVVVVVVVVLRPSGIQICENAVYRCVARAVCF
jgi:hypothetical protein